MNSVRAAAPTQVYEDFVPTTELVQEQDSDTLLLNLTGFRKEQVRVQLTRTGILKISGQRPVGQNKWLRFQKDFPVSENCDKNKISAKFENGILYVKQPKLITSEEKKDKESPIPDALQANKKPTDEPQPQPQPQPQQQQQAQKEEEQAKSEKPASREELAKAEEPKKEEAKTTEAPKELPEKIPDEKTGSTSYENNANMGSAGPALAEKLKMPRKLMNMTLVALLVLGIGLYISSYMTKSRNYRAEE